MSAKTVNKVVQERITVCDICGGEIEPQPAQEKDRDSEYSYNLPVQGHRAPSVPLAAIPLVKFMWPSKKAAERRKLELEIRKDAGEPVSTYVSVNWYDLHGECIANLLEAAIALRVKTEIEEAAKEVIES